MFVKTNDATQLYVNQNGQGPILILVPGANGTGDIFDQTVHFLKENFTVITYDRRGYGQTIPGVPLPEEAKDPNSSLRIKADVADVLTLANTFSPSTPVYLMGTSSGSIVAAEAFASAPTRFAKVAIHECPVTTVLDDDGAFANTTNNLVQRTLKGDFSAVTDLFSQMHIQPLDAQMMGLAAGSHPDKEKMKPMCFWLQYESAQYTNQIIDWQILADHRDQVLLLNGTDSVGFLPQKINQAIGQKINVKITMIPGGHLGYAQKPQRFADKLAESLFVRESDH
ncbi:MAG TPA: alpha/beta hydrolase [Lactobacillus sp.]|nr:alpha/beta hydrolase [Lactobacillus sp.]